MAVITTAIVKLRSTSPYSQSRKHDTPELEGESKDAYEKRTWKERTHVHVYNKGKPSERTSLVIPASGISQAMADAAKFLNKKIAGQGKSTWTKHFVAGVAVLADVDLHTDPKTARRQAINAHANGQRGSGSRVTRYFPTIDEWEAEFEITIFDPIITEAIFLEVLEAAGLFVGIGQFRPQNLGTNGRWEVLKVQWIDDRVSAPTKKAA